MKLTPIKKWISSPLLIPGLIFLFVNVSTSHMFYHVNSYKIVLVILGVTFFAIRNIPFFPTTTDDRIPWKIWGLIAIPLLATFPGLIWHQWSFNYNFRYELAANLVLFLWVVYIYRNVKQEDDLSIFILFIGITVIYTGCWSILEKTGLHPMAWQEPVARVKATFGNTNYFSGFLIVLLPTLLLLAIPEALFDPSRRTDSQPAFTQVHQFYTVAFIFGGLSLVLAQTRAAIVAFILSLALISFLFIRIFATRQWRRRILILYGIGIVSTAFLVAFILFKPELFEGSRFARILTAQAWIPRLQPWEAAIKSIKASPIVGFGLGCSYNLYFAFFDPGTRLFNSETSYNHVHSEILEYLQESGVVGLVAFVIFWAYLIYLLIRLLRSSSTTPTQLKLGIGIAGGFLAYHFHSSFSVAPRMMVTKLPVFTLIALLLVLNKLRSGGGLSEQSSPTMRSRLISGLPTLGVLIVIWTIFLPWAAGQFSFVKIQRERPSFMQTIKLEALVKLSPDIYALDYLTRLQINYKKTQALKISLDTIEAIIPHYRDLGYKKMLLAAINGDTAKIRQYGLAYQEHDRYHLPTIEMLMNHALQTNDRQLFKKQFELFLRKYVFDQKLINSLNAHDVGVEFVDSKEPIHVISQPDKLNFQWSEQLIGLFLDAAQKNRAQQHDSGKRKQQIGLFLLQQLATRPYFQLTVQKEYLSERGALYEAVKKYDSVHKEWEEKNKQLEMEYQAELRRTQPGQRKELQIRQAETLANIRKPYADKMEEVTQPLNEKTDWKIFSRKRQFVTLFVNRFISIVFPEKP